MPADLVIVRAGDNSLHRAWLHGARAGHYGLIVSYFGDDPSRFDLLQENTVVFQGGKWDGIHALFAQQPELLQRHDYFWFPDDDIAASSVDVARIFRVAREKALDVCQPSLSHDSHFSHLAYLNAPSFRLRYSNAIEIMVPCLSRRALQTILPLFAVSRTGFGLDGLWTRLFEDNVHKAAIIDDIQVKHTRPIGGELHRASRAKGLPSANDERQTLYKALAQNLDGIKIYDAELADGRRLMGQKRICMRLLADLRAARKHGARHPYWYHEVARMIKRQFQLPADLSRIDISPLQPSIKCGLPA